MVERVYIADDEDEIVETITGGVDFDELSSHVASPWLDLEIHEAQIISIGLLLLLILVILVIIAWRMYRPVIAELYESARAMHASPRPKVPPSPKMESARKRV